MVLKDLLDERKFRYLRTLNENPDLSRNVVIVESTETPDVAKYIPQNTLLLMTGMAFKDQPAQMCRFLEELNKRSCAGVAIKLGRFIDVLDKSVLDTADQLGIPLLQIPLDRTLGEVYQDILSYIWNNQNNYLLEALNAQKKISNLILQGSSIKSIINNIAEILDKPVMVINLFGEILEYAYTFMKAARDRTVKIMYRMIQEKRLPQDTYCVYEEAKDRFCVYPVKGVDRITNYIVIQDFDPEEKEEHVLIMEQIIMELGLYFYRDLYVKYNEMKSREEFLTVFLEQLDSKTWNERQILAVGQFYGVKQMPEYRVVILEMEKPGRKFNHINFSKKEERYILIYNWINHLMKKDDDILIFPQESKWRYVCVIQGKHEDYMNSLVCIHDIAKEKFGLDITVAQGGIVSSFINIRNSFSEAEQCITDGNRDRKYPYLMSYRPKNMMELFKFIPEKEMKDICASTLKELAYPKIEMEKELRKTLYTYLFCSNSIAKTAESLYLHRNTIKYRLKRCEEILDVDLTDVDKCFQIQLALVLTEETQ